MGREIRRVIPNWQHPKRTCPHSPPCEGYQCYHPMRDESYHEAAREWIREFKEFKPTKACRYYWEYNGNPPDKEYYRPEFKKKDATWLQVYETVSEGTPVTPAFATAEELVNYLSRHGDFWDQRRGSGPWSRRNAEQFVKDEWVPSGIGIPGIGFVESKECPTAMLND